MSLHILTSVMAEADRASVWAMNELVGLAEALGTPKTVPTALTSAKAALASAEEALDTLEEQLLEAMAKVPVAPPPVEDPEQDPRALYRKLKKETKSEVKKLEREQNRIQLRQCRLQVIRNVAVGLMVFCTIPLSLDAVREALGVTQESHVIQSLATVALVTQVALWGSRMSLCHLATAIAHQQEQAQRYQRLERDRATPVPNPPEVTTAKEALGTLAEVTRHLKGLVASVTKELRLRGGQSFPISTNHLGDVVVALRVAHGDKEGTRRLERALEALREGGAGLGTP